MNTKLVLFVSILVVIAVAFVFMHRTPCANFHERILQTPTQNIALSIADSPEKQSRGLGGCTYVPKDAGMYFPFNPPQQAAFWMKDMLIPIDIIWIKNGIVVGINTNVLNEPDGTPDSALKTYPSPGEIGAVLEVEAGKAVEYGVTVGSQVRLTK